MTGEFGVWQDGDAKVFKYPLEFNREGVAETSIPGTIIHLGYDPAQVLCIWAVVWPEKHEPAKRRILMVGTGHPMPEGTWGYLQTIHDDYGIVLHFFVGYVR